MYRGDTHRGTGGDLCLGPECTGGIHTEALEGTCVWVLSVQGDTHRGTGGDLCLGPECAGGIHTEALEGTCVWVLSVQGGYTQRHWRGPVSGSRVYRGDTHRGTGGDPY